MNPTLQGTDNNNISNSYSSSNVRVLKDRGFYGVTLPVTYRNTLNGTGMVNYFYDPFFIANRPYQVVSATERHQVNSGGANATLTLAILPSGTAPISGTSVSSTTFDLSTTADTDQELPIDGPALLATGDALNLIPHSTVPGFGGFATVSGVTVQVVLRAV